MTGFNFLPWRTEPRAVVTNESSYTADELYGVPSQCGVKFQLESEGGEWWVLPVDPVVTVRGGNTIVKRQVLKPAVGDARRRGSVKELWSQDDYEITINGVLKGGDGELPADAVRRLRSYCEAREAVAVQSPLLTLFGISRVVVEKFEFPHTKGMENQLYSLACVSDDFDRDKLLIADN